MTKEARSTRRKRGLIAVRAVTAEVADALEASLRALAMAAVALTLVSTVFAAEPQGVELRYRGSVSKAGRDADAAAEPGKRFEVYCLVTLSRGGKDTDASTRQLIPARRERLAELLSDGTGGKPPSPSPSLPARREPGEGKNGPHPAPSPSGLGEGKDVAFVIDEQGAGGWPWVGRFGTVATDANATAQNVTAENGAAAKLPPAKNRIRLLYEHAGTAYVLAVPFPLFQFADRLAVDARWEAARAAELPSQNDSAPWKYRVSARTKVGGRDCFRVDVTNNFGPQESLWVDSSTQERGQKPGDPPQARGQTPERGGQSPLPVAGRPIVVKAERRFVIGRGEVHVLTMELDSVTPLDGERLARVRRPLDSLLALKQRLKRADDDQSAELSEGQLKIVADEMKSLEQQAEGTPFEGLVASIVRDVNTQSRRGVDVDSLARRMIGKPAPAIRLKSLDGEAIPATELAGKIVLLHFWSYRGEPFPQEPYGQVGFLDHLYHRRNKLGVRIYGVAVDSRLGDAGQAPAAVASVRKLTSFMNLTYPVVMDDGTLERLGDPERVGARLPLWVLIDPKGTVVEYKVGYYAIKPDEGLTQLDTAITGLIRKQRAERATPPRAEEMNHQGTKGTK